MVVSDSLNDKLFVEIFFLFHLLYAVSFGAFSTRFVPFGDFFNILFRQVAFNLTATNLLCRTQPSDAIYTIWWIFFFSTCPTLISLASLVRKFNMIGMIHYLVCHSGKAKMNACREHFVRAVAFVFVSSRFHLGNKSMACRVYEIIYDSKRDGCYILQSIKPL